jgi:hypothetical protein
MEEIKKTADAVYGMFGDEMRRILALFLATLFLFACSDTEQTYINYEEEYNIAQSYIDELESDLEYWMDEADDYEQACSELLISLFKTSFTGTILDNNQKWKFDDFEIMYWINGTKLEGNWEERYINYKFINGSKVDYYAMFYYSDYHEIYEIIADSLIGDLGYYDEAIIDSQGFTQDYYYDFTDLGTWNEQFSEYYCIVAVVDDKCYSAIFNPQE